MQRKPVFLTIIVLLVLSVALPGLAQAQDTTALVVAFDQEFDNLNPMYTTMYFTGISRGLYLAPAWDFDDELNPHPVLVTEIPTQENGGISEDGTVITLSLRDDIVWSDGEALDAEDFLFTYEMILDENNTPLSRFPYDEKVASVDAPDMQTVVVTFSEPFAPWLGWLFSYVLPEHVLRPVFEEEFTLDFAAWNRAPEVGSGPYVFDEWETGSFIRFTRNENFYDELPQIEVVSIAFIPDSAAYVLALENGDADIGTFIAYSDVPRLEENGNVTVSVIPSGYNEAWYMNVNPDTAHPAMLDVNVRKALIMAFNRNEITKELLLGLTYPADSFWEKTPYDNPAVDNLPYDPEMAAQLLDEAGWVDSDGDGIRDKDGEKLSLRYVTNTRQIRMDVQVVAQQQLEAVGVELELINYPSDIYFNSYGDGGPVAVGDYDIAQWSASPNAFPDPDTSRFLCSEIPSDEEPFGNNWTGICDEQLDALFAQQSSTMDYDARIAVFHEIDALLSAQAVWAGVWHDADLWVVNDRVQNARLNGVTPFWAINEWSIE